MVLLVPKHCDTANPAHESRGFGLAISYVFAADSRSASCIAFLASLRISSLPEVHSLPRFSDAFGSVFRELLVVVDLRVASLLNFRNAN